jgi:hypothetical protein
MDHGLLITGAWVMKICKYAISKSVGVVVRGLDFQEQSVEYCEGRVEGVDSRS